MFPREQNSREHDQGREIGDRDCVCVDRRQEKKQLKAPVGDKFTALGHRPWLSNRYCALETRNDTEKIGERRPGHASVASVFG